MPYHVPFQFRLGVVSYGPAETRPTPLLGKHFFAPPQIMMRELREKPEVMGLGLTGSGGPTGMAALEGLVAALEVSTALKAPRAHLTTLQFFDMYGETLPVCRICIARISLY